MEVAHVLYILLLLCTLAIRNTGQTSKTELKYTYLSVGILTQVEANGFGMDEQLVHVFRTLRTTLRTCFEREKLRSELFIWKAFSNRSSRPWFFG